MLPGSVSGTVNEWRTEVRVNGVVRAVESVSWNTEMAGDLPDQVIASGGVGGASGTIAWAPQTAVQSRPVSPWAKVANWPPSPGDLVQVRVSDGVTWWNRFTGVIDKTSGGATSYQSTVRDFSDRITGLFTHEALLRHMTPYLEDGPYRSVGLNFWYPLTQALRSCGFANVPPIEGPSALSATLQGSAWPEAGTVRTCAGSGTGSNPSFFLADFGYAALDFTASYLPRLAESTSTPVQLTVVVPGTHAGVATLDVLYGTNTIRLRVNESRGVTAFFSPTAASPWTTVASVGSAPPTATTVVQLLVKGGAWTLRTSNGATGAGSQSLGSGTMSAVNVAADANARIAGVQVSHPQSTVREFASLGFKPSMRFTPSGLASTMDMMPALKRRGVRELLDEILAATLTAAWWDEEGTLILRPSNVLRGTAPSWTYTTAMDITSLDWEDSLLAVRSGVDVKWSDPTISKGRQYRLELWRATSNALSSNSDPLVDLVEPEDGKEWFGVDRAVRRLDASNWGAYNDRRHSFSGVWISNEAGAPTTWVGNVDITTETLYSDSLKITTKVNAHPVNIEVNTETHPEADALKPHLRAQPLPVIRGMGRGQWADALYSASASTNASAPRLEHDLGFWGQEYFSGDTVAKRIGDYLASMVSTPQPTITGLGVMYDPRRQVGDVYMLRSEWIGIELRCLVTAIDEDHGNGSHQSLTVRVIAATSIRPVTYDDLAAAWGTGNYEGLQAAWAALNYNDFAANPLEGAPNA